MKLSPKSVVTVQSFGIKSDLYEQLLTELAEVIYSSLGPSKKSISTIGGKSKSKKEACLLTPVNTFKEVKSG